MKLAFQWPCQSMAELSAKLLPFPVGNHSIKLETVLRHL